MKRLLLPVFVFIAFVAISQGRENFTREVSEFRKIKASNGVKVNLIKGKSNQIVIHSHGIEQEDIITEVNGKTLKLSIDAWSQLREKNKRWEVEIDVRVQKLDEITSVTGARVVGDFKLSGRDILITGNTGGELYLELEMDEVIVNASTGAILKLKGQTDYLEVTSNMGSEVEASWLSANYVLAKAGMGGTLEVYARNEITSSASLGGVIEVTGNPPRTHTRKNLGGVVNGVR